MKILLFLAFFTSFSIAQICEVQFLRNHYQFEKTSARTLNELFEKTGQTESLKEKIDLLEEQYDIFASLYANKISKAKEAISKRRFKPEKKARLIQEKELEIIHELRLYPNRIINQAKKLFDEAGISVNLKFVKLNEKTRFKYLELGDGSSSSSKAAKTVQRYKERFGTQTVTFDMYQNIMLGSAGFSVSEIGRIDLGIRGMRNLLLDDLITMVGKHEFHHAAFASKRAKNVSSIYHPSYTAIGEKPLSGVVNHYDRYMSAEEVYNWANNSFWASARISNVANYNPADYVEDIKGIARYLGGTKKIAQQTQEITQNFKKAIKEMRKEIREGEFYFILLTEDKRMAETMDEVFHFVVSDDKNSVLLFEFVGPEYADDVAAILAERMKLETKYTQLLPKKAGKKVKKKLFEELVQEENKISGRRFRNVLRTLEEKQATLGRVAKVLDQETDVVMSKTQAFMEKLQKALDANENALKDPEWVEEFQSLAREYRKLGNLVKEDYKGFAGR